MEKDPKQRALHKNAGNRAVIQRDMLLSQPGAP